MKNTLRLGGQIVGVYLTMGTVWIVLSDWLVSAAAPWWVQTAKGLLYVVITALCLFWIVLRHGRRIAEEESRCRSVFETAPVPILVADDGLRIISMNPAAGAQYPDMAKRLRHARLTDLWTEKEQPDAAARLRAALLTGGRFEAKHILKGGKVREVLLTACRLELKSGAQLVLCVQDLTEWREKEKRIELLNRTHALLSSANQAITRVHDAAVLLEKCCRIAVDSGEFQLAWIGLEDRESRAMRIAARAGTSAGFVEMLDARPDALCSGDNAFGKALREDHPVICPITGDNQPFDTCMAEAWRNGFRAAAAFPLKLKEQRRQGVFVLYAFDPQMFSQEQMLLLEELSRNIAFALDCLENERQRAVAQRALRESEERFRLLVENAPDSVLLVKKGRLSYMNPAALALIGATSDEQMIGHEVIGIIHPRCREEVEKRIHAVLYEKKQISMAEADYLRCDGSSVPCEVSSVPVQFEGQEGAIVFVRDVSIKSRNQEQLRQIQRVEAVGSFAGIVAHDFNNLLQVINGASELACDSLSSDSPLRVLLDQVSHAGKRAATLVDWLLIISSRHMSCMECLDLNDVVNALLRRFENRSGQKVKIDCLLSKKVLPVKGDHGTLEHLFFNLCATARDAMPEQGVLTISTEDVCLDEVFCGQNTWAKPGHYAVLKVSDTGEGFSAKDMKDVVEPGASDKIDDVSAGLRLALVNSIVRQHNGFIRVENASGEVMTFHIYLPLAHENIVTSTKDNRVVDTQGGTETILFAEDDETIRSLTSRMLRLAGYTVLEARDGQEAVEVFRKNHKKVDGVVLDVIMPRMGGFEAHEQIRAMSPGMPVVFASAFSNQALKTQFALIDGVNLVKKPYDRRILLGVLRQNLDKAKVPT